MKTGAFTIFAAVVPAMLAGAGFLGDIHPAFDSFGHFRLHLAAAAAVSAGAAIAVGWHRSGLVALFSAVFVLQATVPWVISPTATAQAAPEVPFATYRLLHLNIRFNNATPERVLSLIAEKRPDVVTLNEVSDAWRPHLERIAAAYPHRLICKRRSVVGGVAILSRRPFAGRGRCGHDGAMGVQTVDFNGMTATIVALHLQWPWPVQQPRQITEMEPHLSSVARPELLIAGDFNAAPWSGALDRIASASSTTVLRGIGSTWRPKIAPDWLPIAFGLPIDQVLAGSGLWATAERINGELGTDHLPVLVEFRFSATRLPPHRSAVRFSA